MWDRSLCMVQIHVLRLRRCLPTSLDEISLCSLVQILKTIIAEKGSRDYEGRDNCTTMTKQTYMEAIERIIRKQFTLGTESKMSAEAKDLSSLAKKVTAAHENKSNEKNIQWS